MGRSLSNPLRWLAVLAVIASQGVLASSHLWHDHADHSELCGERSHEQRQNDQEDDQRDSDPAHHDCVLCVLQAQSSVVGDGPDLAGLSLDPIGVMNTPSVREPDSQRSPEPRSRGPPA